MPAFATGAGNSSSAKAGFYRDQLGIVHLQGEVSTLGSGGSGAVFTLPQGFIPVSQTCGSASAFEADQTTFVVNRVCVNDVGLVVNDRGKGNRFISLNGIEFRTSE